jgi:hypothetical protein
MSETRRKKRRANQIDKQEITFGLPLLDNFLKTAMQSYGDHLNHNITQHLAAGHTLPYECIRLEYNIMKGFIPLEAIAEEGTPQEEIEKLTIIKEPETGRDGVEAAYIRMDKVLFLTAETLERKREEIKNNVKQTYMLDLHEGTARIIMYQAMAPISPGVNFAKARYRLIEDFLYVLTTQGLEYQEIQNAEEVQRTQQMQRKDVQDKIKEVEEMFTVSRGGNETSSDETNAKENTLKVAVEAQEETEKA